MKDARISIRKDVQNNQDDEDWMLEILHSKISDSGLYMCQVSTEPPQIHKIYLSVEGKDIRNRNQKLQFLTSPYILLIRCN